MIVHTDADRRVIAIIRRLAVGDISPAECAGAIIALCPDVDGEIAEEALHIAAEFTSDDAIPADAVPHWLALLPPGGWTGSNADTVNRRFPDG